MANNENDDTQPLVLNQEADSTLPVSLQDQVTGKRFLRN